MTPKFPQPEWFGSRRRWRLSSLLEWEAATAGKSTPPPLAPSDEQYLTANQVRARLNVSEMWIWRRLAEHDTAAA